jgi:HEAT repeat protein
MCKHPAALGLLLLAVAALPSAEARAAGEGAAVAPLIETVTGAADPLVRAAAAERLGALDPAIEPVAEEVVPVLIEALAFDLDFPVRGRAAEALGHLGPLTAEVVPALTEALAWDTHLMVRWRAAEALERIGSRQPEAAETIAPDLITALQGDPYPGVRARAARALGGLGPARAPVLAALLAAFRSDSHAGVRWQAAAALESAAVHYRDAEATEVVGLLKGALALLERDPHPDIQRNAAGLRHAIRQLEAQKDDDVGH